MNVRTHVRTHTQRTQRKDGSMTTARYKVPDKRFPDSHKEFDATFILPVEMGFPDSKTFPNRKRMRRFIRSKGYSIKDLQIVTNKSNFDVKVTIPHYSAPK